MNFFEQISAWIDSAEYSFTTFVSKVVPWLVPIIPASITGIHISNILNFNGFGAVFGWVAGIVVEGLGFASVHRLFLFIQNNKRYTADKNQMPVWIPLASFIWYLVIVLVVNTLLELDSGASVVRVVAVGALTTLSIPTMAIIATTAIMTEREMKKPKRTSRNNSITRTSKITSESNSRTGRPSVHKNTVYKFMDKFMEQTENVASFSDVRDGTNLPESTVSRLRNEWISDKTG